MTDTEGRAMSDCTCHPDRAPKPCPRRYQYSECVLAAEIERLRADNARMAVSFVTNQQVVEQLRRERNLATAMLQSAEQELAAERERCAHWKQEADNLIVALRRGVGAAIRKGEP